MADASGSGGGPAKFVNDLVAKLSGQAMLRHDDAMMPCNAA